MFSKCIFFVTPTTPPLHYFSLFPTPSREYYAWMIFEGTHWSVLNVRNVFNNAIEKEWPCFHFNSQDPSPPPS